MNMQTLKDPFINGRGNVGRPSEMELTRRPSVLVETQQSTPILGIRHLSRRRKRYQASLFLSLLFLVCTSSPLLQLEHHRHEFLVRTAGHDYDRDYLLTRSLRLVNRCLDISRYLPTETAILAQGRRYRVSTRQCPNTATF